MDDNKRKALAAALSQIEKQFGKGAVMRMGDKTDEAIEVVSTGSLGLDIALGGPAASASAASASASLPASGGSTKVSVRARTRDDRNSAAPS